MAKTATGTSKQQMAKALGAAGAVFGAMSVLVPRMVANGYGVLAALWVRSMKR